MMKNLIYLLPLLLLFSCREKSVTTITVAGFPSTIELEAKTLETDTAILAPSEMFILNDQLWILQSRNNPLFWVYSLDKGNFLYSTGYKGHSSNEFIHPGFMTIQLINEHTFTMLDNSFLKTIEVSKDGILNVLKTESIFDLRPINGFVRLNDSLYCAFADCATGTESDFEYRIKNRNTNKESKFSEYPVLFNFEEKGDERCQLYYKYLVANAKENKFAAFYGYFNYIRIFKDLELEKEIFIEAIPFKADRENRKNYYKKPYSSEEFIYAPCFSDKIQVWDWEGQPIALLTLEHSFFRFTIDEKRQKLYTISLGEENENKIRVYDIGFLHD
ncbi:MAG: hypothetical protein ACOX59_04850 [Bacteroidales bacterium]|jgi:hypothetical protein